MSAPAVRVLVVDDDAAIRQFIQMALEGSGYEVATAEDGQEALAAVRAAPPRVILLDMRMPVMDGWAFTRASRETPPPHAPIVVLTAARDAGEYASDVDADAFLAKPFNLRELLGLVGRLVRAESS
ncbi:MAG TPA: response regulator [Vicinamibacteria bacterium]|nr:response regulator [Vicinamibacteria bacterium]